MSLEKKVDLLNSLISKELWYDFEVVELKDGDFKIIGSTDFSTHHSLEIIFIDVYHLNINHSWRTDTSNPVLFILASDEAEKYNLKFEIIKGFEVFKIIVEDFNRSFYIAAKEIEFEAKKVWYYDKSDLADGEEIATWVSR